VGVLFDSRRSTAPVQLGWHLEQLIVRNRTRGIETQQTTGSRDTNADQLQTKAKLTSSANGFSAPSLF
jgi:hypothetical protein